LLIKKGGGEWTRFGEKKKRRSRNPAERGKKTYERKDLGTFFPNNGKIKKGESQGGKKKGPLL